MNNNHQAYHNQQHNSQSVGSQQSEFQRSPNYAYTNDVGMPDGVPAPMQEWMSQIPQDNCGEFYYTIKHKWLPLTREYKLEAWGQLCDGRAREDSVAIQMRNKLREA